MDTDFHGSIRADQSPSVESVYHFVLAISSTGFLEQGDLPGVIKVVLNHAVQHEVV